MEICYYCGQQYHPMPVYQLADRINPKQLPRTIHVCHFTFTEDDGFQKNEVCKNKAVLDGYEFRKDLTPKR
jgi:hypothetical protein